MRETSDVRIARSQPLVTPRELSGEFPIDENTSEFVWQSRRRIEAIVSGEDKRLLCIVGPCSVHDPAALLEFAEAFKSGTADMQDAILPVLRVYFEKPRSVIGWKGLINDPDLDGSFHISKGLRLARELLVKVAELELPAATEFLDTTFGQYYADLISFGAIGARTVESQIHRELASGLSMPVGFKNATSGDIGVAIDAIRRGIRRINHVFLQVSKYLFQKSAPYPESFRENPCNSWLSTNIKPSGSGLDCDFS